MGESEGVNESVARACAASFCDGIESASGIRPQLEVNLSEGARLISVGFSPGDIKALAFEASKVALRENKLPPMNLHQLELQEPDERQGKA